ncbi:ST8SIA2 [Branchiostoma lanceolatum]|uniref:ST8SIA2 protein n=1 Tax=Branchiostoma lanceolatum TaxID=7740 RepID=A0A8J9ZDP5_BRALA|nr:ST8SIA2 [Branchiostoma lanceolatum]
MLNRLPIEPRSLKITEGKKSVEKMIRDKIQHLLSPRQNMVLFSEFDANFERCNLSQVPDKNCFGTTPIKHHNACAVVGSSGILLNSSCGNEIDSHDYVIRFNLVPLIKHARDAGMKSNLTVMNVYRMRVMVKRMESGSRRAWERFERINNSMIIYPKRLSRTAYQYRSFINEIYDYPGFHSPTIGLLTSFLALSFCDHVSLYGFYPLATDANNRTVKFHYHDDPLPGEGKILKPHIFNVEYDFMRNLHRVGVWDHKITTCA